MKSRAALYILLQMVVYLELNGTSSTNLSNQEIVISASKDYEDEFIELVEMVYGEGLLSQGGVNSIDEMFEGISLEGLKLLDLGSGLGMHDIHLAKNNNVDVVGLEPQEILVLKANLNLENSKNDLKGSVSFVFMSNPENLNIFEDSYFDVVFSKEAILHVPYEIKPSYFNEIYRVLKPNGQIVIMDWMHSSSVYSTNTQKMMEMDGIVYQLSTPSEYEYLLRNAGFNGITLTDTTPQHAELSQQNIMTIRSLENEIKSRFGVDTYNYSIESWTYQREAFENRELLTGIFKAYK